MFETTKTLNQLDRARQTIAVHDALTPLVSEHGIGPILMDVIDRTAALLEAAKASDKPALATVKATLPKVAESLSMNALMVSCVEMLLSAPEAKR